MRSFILITLVLKAFYLSDDSRSNALEYYVSTEHINVTYVNDKYFAFFRATAARPGRWDYKYYVHMHMRPLITMDNNMTFDYVFYEFRSNEYRRGFVEMHFRFCDLVLKDIFFGPAVRANLPSCPLPPGEYKLSNMSIPDLPLLRTFPFRKGRIYCTATYNGVKAGAGYTDMEIKIKPTVRKTQKNVNKTTVL